jgi:hypothetical protein
MKNLARKIVVLFAFILPCAGATAHSAAVDMKDGEWEVTSETSMTMGTMSMPSMTSKVTHCLTRDDPVPASEKEKDCKVVDQKVVGNTVSWRVVCKDGEGEGEITYRGTSYKGTFRMKMAEGGETTRKRTSRKKTAEDGETMTMNIKLSGKYLGPCPKGQKSGPTGESAKQMAKGQEMAAQAKQQQAEMEAQRRKAEAFLKKAVVPEDEPGACGQRGFGWTEKCDKQVGKLNLQDGEYEITVEEASRFATSATLAEVKRKTVSVGENKPVPQDLLTGPQAETVKRGKNRITWRASRERVETTGGVTYRGTSFEGVVRTETDSGSGEKMLQVRKVTGKRIGEALHTVGRVESGRDYSPKEGGEGDSATGEIKGLKNPVKGIRNLFGL